MQRALLLALLAAGLWAPMPAGAGDQPDTRGIFVKQAIADRMTPEELQAHKERLARRRAEGAFDRAPGGSLSRAPGDICSAATYEIGPLPYPPAPINDTTAGANDNYDLPPDITAPTCTAPSTCVGGQDPDGTSGPRGAIFAGTGTAPDRAWRIKTDTNCTLTINATPTASWDLALVVYQATCSNVLSDCACVDDNGDVGQAESVTLDAVAGTDYFVVIDGYSMDGTPPGPTGPYTLQISGAGCSLVPVELQGFSVQ